MDYDFWVRAFLITAVVISLRHIVLNFAVLKVSVEWRDAEWEK